jgi:hypothetical protein
MNTTNTPAPDYGEPWRVMTHANGGVGTREARPIIEDLRLSRRAVPCVNACAGMTDPAAEIATMRDAINDTAAKLRYIINEADALWDIRYESRAALTKLQPFLEQ